MQAWIFEQPPGDLRRVTRERARFAMHRADVGDVTMIHTRKERSASLERSAGKGYRYRNPGENLRRARLTENYLYTRKYLLVLLSTSLLQTACSDIRGKL